MQAASDGIDDRVEGQGDEHAEADPREHRRRVAQHGEDGQDAEHGGDSGEKRGAIEPEARGEAGGGDGSNTSGDGSPLSAEALTESMMACGRAIGWVIPPSPSRR